jgi:hypothetical protein
MPPAMPSVLLDWSLKVGSERVVPTEENLDALSWSQQIIDRGRQVRNYDMTHSPTRDIASITIAPSTAGTAPIVEAPTRTKSPTPAYDYDLSGPYLDPYQSR